MLRAIKNHKCLVQVLLTKTNRYNNTNLEFKRHHSYQKNIYTSNFSVDDATLTHELAKSSKNKIDQSNLYRFVKAYHQHGHKAAAINPLFTHANVNLAELSPTLYGLNDTAAEYPTEGILFSASGSHSGRMTLNEIESYLKQCYSSEMSIEFEHLYSEEEKLWLSREFELLQNKQLDSSVKIELAKILLKSQALDAFLAAKFPTFKRYSNEGAESSMAFYYSMFFNSAVNNIEQLVMGIAHRGRLNLMLCMLNLDPVTFFAKIKGKSEYSADVEIASGDISHHFACSTELNYEHDATNKKIHVSLMPNPSHLEAVDALVMGKTRSKQMLMKDGLYSEEPLLNSTKVSSLLVHGDAAFAGQGIVSECFQGSRLANYAVGGTVHLITNNQLGFTAPSSLGRSGRYNSDLAKGFDCPVIHINGDHPELAYKAAELAVRYRNKFAKDIVCDLICFRKHGHNELDDPSFTNPLIYKQVNSHQSVPDLYKEKIASEILVEQEKLDTHVKQFRDQLDDALNKVNTSNYEIKPRATYLNKAWSHMNMPSNKSVSVWDTGFNMDMLRFIGHRSVAFPDQFSIHPTVERAHVKKRIERINNGTDLDWSTCEALALGSLLLQGFNVRISGQDVGRGTFSNRHAMLVDQVNSETFIPLNNLDSNQTNFLEICNSYLSEEAVLGFDYGFSLDHPNNLVIWEAQFGDFFNGAQIIIDTYLSSAEAKWLHQSGLVMLLPHGFDGAGPEHSSCRIERFLQMSSSKEDSVDAESVNMFIAHPTTPANYFHLLRRQMLLPFRKPLIVAAPKLLIRLPQCVSSLSELNLNTSFRPVINDSSVKSKEAIKRVIFVFGKHYYALETEKTKRNLQDIAILRVEELSPFPADDLRKCLKEFKNAKEFIWSQEEHRNMGAWSFVSPRFKNILGIKLKYAGREVQACVSGTGSLHANEVKEVLSKPFEKF